MTRAPDSYRVALTKRAFETQLMRAGSPKRAAEQTSASTNHERRWRALPTHVRAEIAWKCLTRSEDKR